MALKQEFRFQLSTKGLEDFLGVFEKENPVKCNVSGEVLGAMRAGAQIIDDYSRDKTYTLKGKKASIGCPNGNTMTLT